MNTKTKYLLKLTLAVVVLLISVISINQSFDFSTVNLDQITAEKPLFGADEFKYEPPTADAGDSALSSKINWAIFIFVILLVLVIANTLDISKYISKITGKETINQNEINKWIMLIFMIVGLAAVVWEYKVHGKLILLNNSASEHGASYDSMFTITLALTTIVFFITQFLLFWFAFTYAKKDGQKALYYSHNNKLEVIWTIIPSIVLTVLVLRGHQTWKSVVYAEDDYKGKIKKIEVFAYQFGWKARYAGEDGVLGNVDYKFISGKNELGLAYGPEVDELLVELKDKIKLDQEAIKNLKVTLESLKADYAAADGLKDYTTMEAIQKQIDDVMDGTTLSELEASIKRKTKQIERIEAIKSNPKIFASTFTGSAEDDIITQEIHLAKDSLVTLNFRSKDIIHSAWLPHFRAQMNVVPGMPTKFTFKPTKSTADAKKEFGEEFEYYLYCNKICGASHYNMKIKVVIESQADVDAWLKSQQPVFKKVEAVPAIMNTTDSTTVSEPVNKLALK
jgi:cytochrome c oxidase subunit II